MQDTNVISSVRSMNRKGVISFHKKISGRFALINKKISQIHLKDQN